MLNNFIVCKSKKSTQSPTKQELLGTQIQENILTQKENQNRFLSRLKREKASLQTFKRYPNEFQVQENIKSILKDQNMHKKLIRKQISKLRQKNLRKTLSNRFLTQSKEFLVQENMNSCKIRIKRFTSVSLVKPKKIKIKFQGLNEQNKQDAPDKKIYQSFPKLPGAQTYRPILSDYDTFQKLLSRKNNYSTTSNFSKRKLFSAQKQASPGPKYSLIAEWSPKNNGFSKTKGSNNFKSTSTFRSPGIYH